MAIPNDLAGMIPGFDFLQTLMKTAGAALPGIPGMPGIPGISQWIAPTMDPEELEKRIQELKTVQFWLEQNAKLLGGTIQALEVQRMTLSTLKSMNLQMGDLQAALKIKPAPAASPAPALGHLPQPASPPATPPASAPEAAAAPAVDPLQWWSALTQQFSEIASKAVAAGAASTASTANTARIASAAITAQGPAAAAPPAAASRKRRA